MRTIRNRNKFQASGFDRLETREVLSHMIPGHAASFFHLQAASVPKAVIVQNPTPVVPVTSTNLTPHTGDLRSGPMAKLGNDLINLYQAFLDNSSDSTKLQASFPRLQIDGNKVLINVQTKTDVNAFAAKLTNLGMDVTAKSAQYGWVTGSFPINQLLTLASLPDTLSGQPSYRPVTGGMRPR